VAYQAYEDRVDVASWAIRYSGDVPDDAEAYDRVMADDALYQATRKRWPYILQVYGCGGEQKSATLAAEVLGIDTEDAGKRLEIAHFAAYIVGSMAGDYSPEVEETVAARFSQRDIARALKGALACGCRCSK
jgi:hypothetical protein